MPVPPLGCCVGPVRSRGSGSALYKREAKAVTANAQDHNESVVTGAVAIAHIYDRAKVRSGENHEWDRCIPKAPFSLFPRHDA